MDSTLPTALKLMFGHEGGYSNAKTDRGGPTKYGITHTVLAAYRGVPSVTPEQVKALTLDEATEIYTKTYWSQSGGSLLPVGLDYAAFDFGVNSGPSRAVKTLQQVLGINVDGSVGALTVKACNNYPGGLTKLIQDYCDARLKFVRGIGGPQGFSANGRGWTRRITGIDPLGKIAPEPGVVGNALRLALDQNVFTPPPPPATGTDFKESSPKASPIDTGLTEILKKPEAWGPLGGLITSFGALLVGEGPIQYAMAFGVIVGVGVGLYYFIHRMRHSG